MQAIRAIPLILALACSASAGNNPVSSVLSLLDDLAAKVTKDGEVEAKAFEEYMEWCKGSSTQLGFDIQTATTKKEDLEAANSKAAADVSAAAANIEQLAANIAADSANLQEATAIRAREAADFSTIQAELLESIDALTRAINVLSKEAAKNPAAFAQVDTSNFDGLLKSLNAVVDAAALSSADKQKLVALVQSTHSSDDEDFGAPAGAVYKTHSGNIIDVLEDLKEKAEGQLSDLRKAETNAKHNYAMLKQSLEDSIAADSKDKDDELAAKNAAASAKASGESDLAETLKDLAGAKEALAAAQHDCMQVATDHEATVAGRAEELKVIAQAKKILVESTTGAVSQTYSMLQFSKRSQLNTRADLAGAEVVTLVKRLANEHHSAALAQLASRIAAVIRMGDNPFGKVKGLIQDLIAKLEAEAQADATEKAWCDEQMSKTEAKKSELEGYVAKLTANINKAAAASATAKAEAKATQAELAELASLQAKMDKIRQEENAAFVQAKADLEQGLEGVRAALSTLRDYYGAGAASMTQITQPAKPVLHSAASGAGGSIIGILEVCESDFAKNLAEEEMSEADAADDYAKTTQENKVTQTRKEQDVKYLTEEFQGLDKKIAELSADRNTDQTELNAVLDYYSKVKERCIAKPETYEERKRRRAAEIQGLKSALDILENETAFVQRKRGSRGVFLGA